MAKYVEMDERVKFKDQDSDIEGKEKVSKKILCVLFVKKIFIILFKELLGKQPLTKVLF